VHLPRGSAHKPAWRFNLAKTLGGGGDRTTGNDAFGTEPDGAVVARQLQDCEEENIEDIDLALRAITYCPNDPRVALQALKMVGIIAFRHPEGRAFLSTQAYVEVFLAMDNFPDDEDVQVAAVAAMKYLTCGEITGNDGSVAGDDATPCATVSSAEHFDLEAGNLFNDMGAGDRVRAACARHPNNIYLAQDAKKVLANISFADTIYGVLDIDGDGKIEAHELEALAAKLGAKDLDGDGKFSQDELVKCLQKHLDVDGDGNIGEEEMDKLKNVHKGIDQHGYVEDDTVGEGSRKAKKMPGLAR